MVLDVVTICDVRFDSMILACGVAVVGAGQIRKVVDLREATIALRS